MPTDCLPYRETGYFSKLICDYLDQNDALKSFYHRFPSVDNLIAQADEKGDFFSTLSRKRLHSALLEQYKNTDTSAETLLNLERLAEENSFTITTGHQLNLFTGPLYFLYKIISVINLCKELSEKDETRHYIPVYWMATEDHDFDEINYFNFQGKKVQWNREASGAVGELSTQGLAEVLELFKAQLGSSKNAQFLSDLFENTYLNHNNLADATRYLANELFKDYGLIIVDGNDAGLKSLFTPYVKRELLEEISHKKVTEQTAQLTELGYPEQVHPREINLFYIKDGIRERIIKMDDVYVVNDMDVRLSESEILSELENHPERFSPNALLRPLFQEVILPNLCYIGGGGELAYWFQLKTYFEEVGVPFPTLLLRNSVLIRTEKHRKKAESLGVSLPNLFLKQNELINRKIRAISNIEIDFSEQRSFLKEQFRALYLIAGETDASFKGAVKAQEVKQLKGLDNLESRLLRAQKRKLSDHVQRLVDLQNDVFPMQSLQERNTNFAEFYLEFGEDLIPELVNALEPLGGEFTVVTL
ncbi:bacillithiol biosynthesis cysteine-adding enzyme BshC [Dokdonia sinensis]|uniref:Putative cysteine ligase BshC n=1 Tax=Dokdonia sinensis TaxID=2479847 RepID=A0A3M0GH06_9FLAO|nr:bacillithiol biosynthesis cysteine-adding enzyme BshC [Dokdonia sinensis]RMB63950.1 bacillithiol biosynthesis cysteine-adding enzyme BshC [Dokdonia sinensis]